MRIITPVVMAFGVTAIRDMIEKGHLRLTVLVGSFVAGTLLLAMNEVAPPVALAFAWLLAVTAITVNGPIVFRAVSGGLS